MKITAFLGIFVLFFAGIAITAESLVVSEAQVGVSSMSCGVSASTMEVAEKGSNPLSNVPDGLPGPAPPKLKGAEQWGGVEQSDQNNICNNTSYNTCRNTYCYTGSCGNTWQAVRGQPVRNVVRFFHNRRPLRRLIGGLFGGWRCR